MKKTEILEIKVRVKVKEGTLRGLLYTPTSERGEAYRKAITDAVEVVGLQSGTYNGPKEG